MTPQEYKLARVTLGHTQGSLAKRLGLRRETIARRESGKGEIHAEAALAIQSLKSGHQAQALQLAAINAYKERPSVLENIFATTAPVARVLLTPEAREILKDELVERKPLFGGMLKAPKK